MNRFLASIGALALVVAAQAQTNSTMTVQATITIGATASASGTATFANANLGSGTFSAPNIAMGASLTSPFTITLTSGGTGTLTGTISLPTTILAGGDSATGTMNITSGTGAFAGVSTAAVPITGTGTINPTTGSISVNFTGRITVGGSGTGGGGGTATGASITDILDAGSYTKNIAQGSIFVVKGSSLSASGFTQAAFPLPTTLGDVSITVGSTAAYMIYDYNQGGVNQLAAVMPSSVAPGNYTLTVKTNTGATATAPVTVVQRKPGIITQDSSGAGLAVVQNYISATQYDIDRFTVGTVNGLTISPARPGQVLIAWLTGLGPVSGGDNVASPGHDFLADNVDIQVLVGGRSIKPIYAGRAPGLAGADQINFVLPADIDTGCTVPFQVSAAGQLSNMSFISIAPNASANACVAPGITTAQLTDFDNGKTMTVGNFTVSQMAMSAQGYNMKINSASGGFYTISGYNLDAGARYLGSASNGCQVIRVKGDQSQLSNPATIKGLDAGTVTLTGPSGSNLSAFALTKDATSNSYFASLGTEGLGVSIPGQANAVLVPGNYTLNGGGGTDVGSFTATTTLSSPLTITGGLPATVNRGSDMALRWTGGGTNDLVMILGYSGTSSGSGTNATVDATEFVCTTTAGQGGFTVSKNILGQLPATVGSNATGFLEVFSTGSTTTFSAPLKAGGTIQNATFGSSTGTGAQVTYQ